MRAVRVSGLGEVSVVETDPPAPAPGEVVVTVEAVGICSTDRKLIRRELDEPRTPGHEVAGRLPDGTRVGVHPEIVCGTCDACRAGWENRCPYRVSLGLGRDGGLGEAVAVPEAQLVPVGELEFAVAAMLEPLACAVHAVAVSQIPVGAPAAVVGGGAMGILCAWVLQASGSRVAICQRSHERRHIALDLGIDVAVAPDDDVAAALGTPPDAVIVTAPGSEPLAWALDRVVVGGIVHAFAGTPGGAAVDANTVHYRHLRLVGSTGSRRADYIAARDLVAAGEIKLDHLPAEVLDLDAAPDALRGRPSPPALKTVVAVGEATRRASPANTGTGGSQP